MHIHILGICGTFMGGLAVLAKQAGHQVTGCDANVYPPMSTQLEAQGISLTQGFGAEQVALAPDLFVVGNVVSRGNPLMEEILNKGLAYTSGPQWMGEHILADKWVLAVAGTHGKTTTAAMLTWILEDAGYHPGFLIGGVPMNFGISARLADRESQASASPFFVIEADEYDTAFFDKRSKFVHYHAKTAILNNLEYDHADIFPDLGAIETQFHHLVRTVPGIGRLVVNAREPALQRVLARGCWSETELFGLNAGPSAQAGTQVTDLAADQQGWSLKTHADGNFAVFFNGDNQGTVNWSLTGEHNRMNALAAIAAARHVGVPAAQAVASLARFENVKRRMELRGTVNQISVYDDFAHHPTAIATTIAGVRRKIDNAKIGTEKTGPARILAVLEPRSNTMKLGAMKDALPDSLNEADLVFGYGNKGGQEALGWDLSEALSPLGDRAAAFDGLDQLVHAVVQAAQSGDQILVMSNGGFGGVHQKLLDALSLRFVDALPGATPTLRAGPARL
ncbi:UDP-N-acetylmuramate:L-alanyl-gamma-D-glutamyl-meso-diaminopimelate ligase [Glaciimonas immobilis]|uniref:UDP-N-acetylmuramate--L-alanyl-gamma-D-glutamyl-meso-2,6-diaminoheptandioate ligase n=1 Tax=Glaciimonas immobilis TaxID=728004 RepID=A0A840RTD7_9BURK|nr:UDP-N-acetylmuramate:L-alanyl-gamma-D-glutamyl-meso-diaminopimelate ligase [Glaciimonas immobilis]KAF3997423.1 UDP-N-acetylmuramate:L-alanyl-gamma-D-glutamyl-meso-diaminopimelate ligase [Glaciimonas immobilis]MBB5200913.1 UDP-N-acetylmuramate: L-alanyl-gamma-D-glutamyl-meso-diaminopimelate ligase [Glaciimonas immobilis]